MKPIEKEMIHGMTNLLNDIIESYDLGKPIVPKQQLDMRINDLKELEKETGYILVNTPTQEINVKSTVTYLTMNMDECDTVDKIIDFFNNEKLVASANPKGINVLLAYKNGILTSMKAENKYHIKQFKNVPYKIEKEKTFIVKGKAVPMDDRKLYFYVTDMIDGSNDGIYDSLQKAEVLGFDVVPYWNAAELNPKTIQSFIDFAFDYAEDDEEIPCDGIAFRYDNINNKPFRYEGIIYKK